MTAGNGNGGAERQPAPSPLHLTDLAVSLIILAICGFLFYVTTSFDRAESIFQIKCDVHAWMLAYIGVFEHPFFSVTGSDGTFTIAGLPAGTYEITAWHERLGTQTASITVGADETTSQNFTFAVPAS